MGVSSQSIAEQRRYWQQHIEQWSGRDQSVSAYCAEAGLCPKQFRAWRQRLRRAGWQPSATPAPTLIALEVQPRTEPAEPMALPITIRLASGLGVEVHAGFDVPTLQAVVKALEAVNVRA